MVITVIVITNSISEKPPVRLAGEIRGLDPVRMLRNYQLVPDRQHAAAYFWIGLTQSGDSYSVLGRNLPEVVSLLHHIGLRLCSFRRRVVVDCDCGRRGGRLAAAARCGNRAGASRVF